MSYYTSSHNYGTQIWGVNYHLYASNSQTASPDSVVPSTHTPHLHARPPDGHCMETSQIQHVLSLYDQLILFFPDYSKF